MPKNELEAGRLVTVYFGIAGWKDGIAIEVLPSTGQGEDDWRVWFPHVESDKGGIGSLAIVCASQIVTVGPRAVVRIPYFE